MSVLRIAVLVLCVGWPMSAAALPSFTQVQQNFRSSDTLLLDRDGQVLHRIRTDASVRRGQWVALSDISPALRLAMVSSEDQRFYKHSGVDWQAVSAAAWGNLWNHRTRGASTLTMQLAGLLDEDWAHTHGGRSVVSKLGQVVAASRLEQTWRKDQILEAYLNLVPFRGELVGIDALAHTLFGKEASGLDAREAAIAAALVRAPNAKVAQVARRACGLLRIMQRLAVTIDVKPEDCTAMDMFASAVLQQRLMQTSEGIAPHLARRVVSMQKEGTFKTTLNAALQRFAVQTLMQHLRELQGRHVEDGALVVLDNASGQVLAWVGSSGALSQASEVDGVTALRQAGSTLKPFLYAQALTQGRLTAASLLEDAPTHIPTPSGLYIPQNYDRHFKGWVSVRTALGASLNVPAVRTLAMVSPDAFHQQLLRLGLPLRETGDYYGLGLALGSAEVSLLTLTNAYRSLANGGRYSATVYSYADKKAVMTPVLDSRAAFIVADILSDANARSRTFGTDSVLATRFWTAVKTGTSKDMRDNWAVGWSARYTVGVWVGNASGASMWNVSGTTGAAPIWAALMQYLHRYESSRSPKPPTGVLLSPVQFDHQLEAARSEWFIQGTEQPAFTLTNTSTTGIAAHITEPTSGTIVALDPDIPPNRQRLRLAAVGNLVRWRIDGRELARGNQVQWLPWPGRHVVQLVSNQGAVLDEVRLEVRGAGLKTATR